jgi:hypothetical protein
VELANMAFLSPFLQSDFLSSDVLKLFFKRLNIGAKQDLVSHWIDNIAYATYVAFTNVDIELLG